VRRSSQLCGVSLYILKFRKVIAVAVSAKYHLPRFGRCALWVFNEESY
jgi:hypothetical protein